MDNCFENGPRVSVPPGGRDLLLRDRHHCQQRIIVGVQERNVAKTADPEALTIDKPMVIQSYDGPVTIGP